MRPHKHWLLSRYDETLIPTLFLFVIGNALAWAIPGFVLFDWGVVFPALVLLAVLLVYSPRRAVIRSVVWIAALIAGGLYYQGMAFAPGPFDVSHQAGRNVVVEGMIVHRESGGRQGELQVLTVNGRFADGTARIRRSAMSLPESGTVVEIRGNLLLPREAAFAGSFDEARFLHAQRISAVISGISSLETTRTQPVSWRGHVARTMEGVRDRITHVFSEALPSPASDILAGVVLGSHAVSIDAETKRQFIDTGLIHFLAASGLNVGIIAGFIFWVCHRTGMNSRWRLIIAMIAVAVYTMLAGLSPSVVRAGTMLELALIFKLMDRQLSHLFLLALAVTIMVLATPEVVGSLGFQFSVLTTFGIITMVPPLQEWLGRYITRWLSGTVLVPFVAQIWVLPLSVFHFNQLPLHSVALNVLSLIMIAPLTAIGFTAGALSLVWEPLGWLTAMLSWPFAHGMLWIVRWGDGMAWAQWHPPSPDFWLLAGLYLLLIGMVFLLHQFAGWPMRRKALALAGTTALLLLPLTFARQEDGQAVTMDLVPLSYRHAAVVVQSGASREPVVFLPEDASYLEGRTLAGYLKHRGIQTLSALVLSPAESGRAGQFQKPLSPVAIRREVHLARLTPGQVMRYGGVTIEGLGHQALRQFRVRSGDFCLLSSSRLSDTFACPAVLNIRQHGHPRLWSIHGDRPIPLDTPHRIRLSGRRITIF